MGDIPAKTDMVSSIIIFPLPGSATIESDTAFNISVQVSNLVAGFFTNADATYYAAPQALSGGKVVGHTHVTVQDLGASLNPTTALDPTQFAFFKGINDDGNGQGLLQATVTGGLPAGNYRVCTMASASNHQPVLMPVAQRGTPDDCTKFTVIGSGTTINVAANDGSKGIAAAALAASAVAAGPDFSFSQVNTGSAAASSVASSSTSESGKGGKDVSTTSVSKSTSIKGDKGAASTSVSTSTSNKGGKGDSSSARFQNTTVAANTKTKGGNGKGTTTTLALSTSDAGKVLDTSSSFSSVAAASTTSKSGKGGKGGSQTTSASGSTTTTVIVKKVVVIETFFEFVLSLGGLCPSVGKSGDSFSVLDELFDDLASAASAACGHQFTACVGFSEAGFSFEECSSQQDACSSVASTASATAATPGTITATATVPPSATVTGSVLSAVTLTTTQAASTTAAQDLVVATSESSPQETGSLCSISTNFVTVDAPAPTGVANIETSSTCSLVTSTVFVDDPSATPEADIQSSSPTTTSCSSILPSSTSTANLTAISPVADPSALGGIAAPAITDSGDSTRPFEVNGNTFVNKSAAVQRSCDIQFNACANAFNSGSATGFNLSDCQTQEDDCITANS
jgi:hypothetical protein